MKRKLFIATLSSIVTLSAGQSWALVNYPSGEIICASDGNQSCYQIYNPPGGSASKKYISRTDVLKDTVQVAPASTKTASLSNYPDYNWNLGLQCGSVVKDASDSKLYIMQPIAADGDFGSGVFSYSNVFPLYVPSLSTSSLAAVAQPANIKTLSGVDNVLGSTVEGIYLPACTIVQQQGTGDFYRLGGYVTTQGMRAITKSYIGSNELLQLWLKQTGFYLTNQQVSGYPNAANMGLPPGMLVKSTTQSDIYFTNDNGTKNHVASMANLFGLGYLQSDIQTVAQSSIDATPNATPYDLNP